MSSPTRMVPSLAQPNSKLMVGSEWVCLRNMTIGVSFNASRAFPPLNNPPQLSGFGKKEIISSNFIASFSFTVTSDTLQLGSTPCFDCL